MNCKFFQYIPYAGLALTLAGIVMNIKKSNRMLICSPMMDDGLGAPIADYIQKHPGVIITKEVGEQILRNNTSASGDWNAKMQ